MAEQERTGLVKFVGAPVTLVGHEVKEGDLAPSCSLIDPDMAPFDLASYRGKILVLLTLPSLDTPVCDRETRRFSLEAGQLGPDVKVAAVSMDLPFAQQRWAAAAEVDNVDFLSDYRDASFGKAYGILAKELRLLARAVYVLDREGVVRYVQLMDEVAKEPDYEAVKRVIKELA